MPGRTRGRAPVAMMMCLAWYAPDGNAPFGASTFDDLTVILPDASIEASPQITVILFFLNRNVTPSARRLATPRERLITAAGSKLTSLAERPKSLACVIRWNTSAER